MVYISGYIAAVCFISTVYISSYYDAVCNCSIAFSCGCFIAVCFIFLATAMLFVIVVSLLDQICGCYIRCMHILTYNIFVH